MRGWQATPTSNITIITINGASAGDGTGVGDFNPTDTPTIQALVLLRLFLVIQVFE